MSQTWPADGQQQQARPQQQGGSSSGGWPDVPRPQTGLPPSVQSQLTPREAEALRAVKLSSDRARLVGNLLGGTAAYLFAQRRKPSPPGLVGQIGYALFGSFAGGFLCMPFGMLLATKHLRNVEDPRHLASVMQSAVDQRRGRPPLPVGGPATGAEQGQGQGQGQSQRQGPAPMQGLGYAGDEQQNRQGRLEGLSMNSQDGGSPFDSQPSSSSSPYDSPSNNLSNFSNDSNSNSNADQYSGSQQQQQQQQQQPASRWAQLRGERGVQASAWDRIRQDRARDAMSGPQRGGTPGSSSEKSGDESYDSPNGQGLGPQGSYGQTSGSRYGNSSNLADPTFGKGTSNNRDQARQEFEASFEREKRGLDG